jgi:hypothetical protein
MTFIEGELFQDKTRNLGVYESLFIDLICTESIWHFMKGFSTIREKTSAFTKVSLLILFPYMVDGIY